MLELLYNLYFRQAASSIDLNPNFIFLPTLLYNDAEYLYGQTPRTYSHNLVKLRERIRAIRIDLLSFFICHEGYHYLTFNYQRGLLEHDANTTIHWAMLQLNTS